MKLLFLKNDWPEGRLFIFLVRVQVDLLNVLPVPGLPSIPAVRMLRLCLFIHHMPLIQDLLALPAVALCRREESDTTMMVFISVPFDEMFDPFTDFLNAFESLRPGNLAGIQGFEH